MHHNLTAKSQVLEIGKGPRPAVGILDMRGDDRVAAPGWVGRAVQPTGVISRRHAGFQY